MTLHPSWEPGFAAGHELVDAQHRGLLAQCEVLADHCGAGEESERRFDDGFDRLKALVREHFETEASLLAALGDPGVDDHRFEFEEFEVLAGEIVTTEHFDRLELQRFVALWCIGHITASAAQLRALLVGRDAADAAASGTDPAA